MICSFTHTPTIGSNFHAKGTHKIVIDFASINDFDLATKRAVAARKLIRANAIAGRIKHFDRIDKVESGPGIGQGKDWNRKTGLDVTGCRNKKASASFCKCIMSVYLKNSNCNIIHQTVICKWSVTAGTITGTERTVVTAHVRDLVKFVCFTVWWNHTSTLDKNIPTLIHVQTHMTVSI